MSGVLKTCDSRRTLATQAVASQTDARAIPTIPPKLFERFHHSVPEFAAHPIRFGGVMETPIPICMRHCDKNTASAQKPCMSAGMIEKILLRRRVGRHLERCVACYADTHEWC